MKKTRVLDKAIDTAPWAQMSEQERANLTAAGSIEPWMFQRRTVLTVTDEDGNTQECDGAAQPVGEVVAEVKPTLGERVREKKKKSGGE